MQQQQQQPPSECTDAGPPDSSTKDTGTSTWTGIHTACQQSFMTRIRAHPRIHDVTHVRRLNAHTSAHGACARAAPLRMTNVDCLCWASSNKLRAEAHIEHKPVVAILPASCRRSPGSTTSRPKRGESSVLRALRCFAGFIRNRHYTSCPQLLPVK